MVFLNRYRYSRSFYDYYKIDILLLDIDYGLFSSYGNIKLHVNRRSYELSDLVSDLERQMQLLGTA